MRIMEQTGLNLPSGYRLIFHEEIGSTNTEALRLAAEGEEGGLWVWAARQTAGKGRAGREWVSAPGNLFASLLLRPHVPLHTVLQLSLVAGVAAHDALTAVTGEQARRLDIRLKWPNDILFGDAKLGGILLESASGSSPADPTVVIGTGINLSFAPDHLGRSVASLAGAGCPVAPEAAFAALAWATAEWVARWQGGLGFDAVRAAWAERAQPVGQPISVHLGTGRINGTFLGIDEVGALRLSLPGGEERRIMAGDVSIGAGA
jgi:BirA family transcriptional regulator, biotin operon repressor / biotin---[acetyl-CoA-carboxylase] ligase